MNLAWYEENKITLDDSIGIDEVGRGPLAGPVVASAVWISSEFVSKLQKMNIQIRDSKKMTPKQRKKVMYFVETQPFELIRYSISHATVEEIDKLNILNASLLAMGKAFESLGTSKKYALIDGNKAPTLKNTETITITKGDDKILSISLASIIAKEYRDNLMRKLAEKHLHYGWETNVGYGSKKHIRAILEYGITQHHRKSFSPIKEFI